MVRFRVPILIMLLLGGVIGFSADFSGKILNVDTVPVSGAKIIIFNEFSITLVRRAFTDRNGSFKVVLPPGSYLVWVTRDGYAPYFERIIIPSGDTSYTASWLLHQKNTENGNQAPSLKHILRHAGGSTHRQSNRN